MTADELLEWLDEAYHSFQGQNNCVSVSVKRAGKNGLAKVGKPAD